MKRTLATILCIILLFGMITAFAEAWTCPNCGKESDMNFCPWCGTKKPSEVTCPSCGAVYDAAIGYAFCTECGTSLTGTRELNGQTASDTVGDIYASNDVGSGDIADEAIEKADVGTPYEAAGTTNIDATLEVPEYGVGDIVIFGHYEQDNDESNGKEEIEWQILDISDGKALLISKYGLDAKVFNKEYERTSWAKCTLRSWLNGTFMEDAFSADEKTVIQKTKVDNSEYQGNGIDGGKDTEDSVFLLSYYEAFELYFLSDEERMCGFTKYAKANGAWGSHYERVDGRPTGIWWLRSRYNSSEKTDAVSVYYGGRSDYERVDCEYLVVRPALWIDTESNIYKYGIAKSEEKRRREVQNSENMDLPNSGLSKGDIVTFGHYEQDDDESNGKEEIEWQILDVQNNKALLLSAYGLNAKAYNEEKADITWEQCTLRAWLNGAFMEDAFSAEEQQAIMTTRVDNSINQGYYATNGGSDTEDKVFLLSYYEAYVQYFMDINAQECAPTPYAIARGAEADDRQRYRTKGRSTGWWWLRSPGYQQNDAASVGFNSSHYVSSGNGAVRPAVWIDLGSDILKLQFPKAEEWRDSGAAEQNDPWEYYSPGKKQSISVGDIVIFGHYEQDNDLSNGTEPIDWIVLENDGRTLTMVSRYGMDRMLYNDEYISVTWETCTLRKWLNTEFLNDAFTVQEQDILQTVTVTADENPEYSTGQGRSTQDKVYILSYNEFERYLNEGSNQIAEATDYAVANGVGADVDRNSYDCVYWLRTLGAQSNTAVTVSRRGDAYSIGNKVHCTDVAVRPVVTVALKAEENPVSDVSDANGTQAKQDSSATGEKATEMNKDVEWKGSDFVVGDTVTFGHYEQDNNYSNGKEAIEWQVLDIQENKVLLISKCALDCQKYNTSSEVITWENCTLRTWLNETFIEDAFTEEERKTILITDVDNSKAQGYSWWMPDGGNDTQDRVFLLSNHEAFDLYFKHDGAGMCTQTDYAISLGLYGHYGYDVGERSAVNWWLRSPGANRLSAAYMDYTGARNFNRFTDSDIGVRPALWLDLGSGTF